MASQKKPPVMCKSCNKKMKETTGSYIRSEDRIDYFHSDCVKCQSCSKKLDQEAFLVDNKSKVVCKDCNTSKFLPKCESKS